MKKIVIIGKGGFAKEVKWLIDSINRVEKEWEFLGYIDKEKGAEEVISDDSYIINTEENLFVTLAIGNPTLRKNIYEKYKENKHLHFPNLIAPSVYVSDSIQLGEGNIICSSTIMTVDILIGNFNIINLDCTIGHDVKIGNFNTINPGSNISGNVILKDLIEVGTGSKIIQGKEINKGVVIGAGAVVIKDVPCDTTVVGVPAIAVKKKDR